MCSLVRATLIQYHIDTGSRCRDSSPFEPGHALQTVYPIRHVLKQEPMTLNGYVRGSQIRRGRAWYHSDIDSNPMPRSNLRLGTQYRTVQYLTISSLSLPARLHSRMGMLSSVVIFTGIANQNHCMC